MKKTSDNRRTQFIKALAAFLADNQAGKSIAIELETKFPPVHRIMWAQEWAKLRGATPLFGYPTVEEAERTLAEFLK